MSLKSESYTSANSKFTTAFLEIQYFSPSGIYIIKFASIFIFLPFKYIPLIRGSQLGVILPPRAHLAMSRDVSVVTTVYGGCYSHVGGRVQGRSRLTSYKHTAWPPQGRII